MRKNGKYFNCLICYKKFYRRASVVNRGNVQFCSKKCQGFSLRGTHISEQQKELQYFINTRMKVDEKLWSLTPDDFAPANF